MADENTTTRLPSIEDLASRMTALENSQKHRDDLLNELAIETGQSIKQLKEMITASKRVDAIIPPRADVKKDAWGNALGPDGKVVPRPATSSPAPLAPAAAPAAAAPACSCKDHEPQHGPKGCTVKGCSCSETG